MADNRMIGVCYYPEHWPETTWENDAARMAALGIDYVRIGEFAWSRLEPTRDDYRFDWLEHAIEILHSAGLKVILGTPTTTPPKWLVDEMPDILPVNQQGQVLGFGSRRHYCFSHEGFQAECVRIVTALAQRFGNHPGVVAWQIDNEYGCHDTARSWANASLSGFRRWLKDKYQTIDQLNKAWGNVFWSMEYVGFESVPLPAIAPTEMNPSHQLDFYRFSSDQIVAFNRRQTEILRALSPGRDLIHNFMGRTLTFDHFELGADLDVSSWDSYPLGFLEDRAGANTQHQRNFVRAGDPDFQAFHHDLYRATSAGRWWVMEQQPGPVNWADHNPVPRKGMIRLWTWEAFAHGAEVVSYFRWRQAPFAQEQMHAGLLRPDGVETEAFFEAKSVVEEMQRIETQTTGTADVALVLDYTSSWAWETQPQGREFDYFELIFDHYRALRRLGLSVDIVSADTEDLSKYRMVVIPGLFAWKPALLQALATYGGITIVGPRSGSKTEHFNIPDQLPPNLPRDLADIIVTQVESLRPDCPIGIRATQGQLKLWREFAVPGPDCHTLLESDDGVPVLLRQNRLHYLAGWPDDALFDSIFIDLADKAGLAVRSLPQGLRIRQNGNHLYVFNYGDSVADLEAHGIEGDFLLGQSQLPPSGVAVVDTGSNASD